MLSSKEEQFLIFLIISFRAGMVIVGELIWQYVVLTVNMKSRIWPFERAQMFSAIKQTFSK